MGEGPVDAVGVLIGESPGYDEANEGRPFVGATGKQLDRSLVDAKLLRSKLFVVNAICCTPTSKSEVSMGKAVRACRPAFLAQMKPFAKKPKFVMGKWALVAHAGKVPKGGIEGARGFVRDGYIASWHPTWAFFHNPFEWGAFEVDLSRFARLVSGKLGLGPEHLHVNPGAEDVRRVVQNGEVAVDIETAPADPARPWTGKDPLLARLKKVGLGNSRWGLSITWPPSGGVLRELKTVLRSTTIVKIFHNGYWFDLPVLKRYGLEVK